MKVKVLKELIKEEIIDINNLELFETLINLDDKTANFLLNIKSKKVKKSLINIFWFVNDHTSLYDEVTRSICNIKNEETLEYSLPLIDTLTNSYYILKLSKEKIILTINSLANIKCKETIDALTTILSNQEILNLNIEHYKTIVNIITDTENTELLKIYLQFILNDILRTSNFYNYILNDIKNIKDPNVLVVLLNIVTTEHLINNPKNYKFAFDIAKYERNIDTLYPLSEILIYHNLLKLSNYQDIINKLIHTNFISKYTYYNAFLDIIYNIDGDENYNKNYYIFLIDTLAKIDTQNIWDFIDLASDSDLYNSNHYKIALNCFTNIKNATICGNYCEIAWNTDLLEDENYTKIITLTSRIESLDVFNDFEELMENEDLKESDYYLFALESISKIKISPVSNEIKNILIDTYFLSLSDYESLVTNIINLQDINKIKFISEFLTWNQNINDETELTYILNNAVKVDNTQNLKKYFEYIKDNYGIIDTEYLLKTSNIISRMNNDDNYEPLVELLDTIYSLKIEESEKKNNILSGIAKLLTPSENLEDTRKTLLLSLPLETFCDKILRNLTIAIADTNFYNSNHFEYSINLFKIFNEDNCEVLTEIITNHFLLEQKNYEETIDKILKIKNFNLLKHLSELISMLGKTTSIYSHINLYERIINIDNERMIRNIENILRDLSKIVMINNDPLQIIEEYLKNSNNNKSKILTRISSSSNNTVIKYKSMLYVELLSKDKLEQKEIYYLDIPKQEKSIIEEELLDTSTCFQTESILLFSQTSTTEELLEELNKVEDTEEASTLTLNKRK